MKIYLMTLNKLKTNRREQLRLQFICTACIYSSNKLKRCIYVQCGWLKKQKVNSPHRHKQAQKRVSEKEQKRFEDI